MVVEARLANFNVKIFSGSDIRDINGGILESRIIYKDAETLAMYINPNVCLARYQQLIEEAVKA